MNVLILLMGGNPLPNFICADYLLNSDRDDRAELPVPEKIFFISTERTKGFYNRINELLNNKHKDTYPQTKEIKLFDKHRSSDLIQKKIKETLRDEGAIHSLHINYTGGTKPMAVNAVATAIEFFGVRDAKLILSDIDPDIYKMNTFMVNPNGQIIEENGFPSSKDLRYHVHLKIDEIFELHNKRIANEIKVNTIIKNDLINIFDFSHAMTEDYNIGDKRKQFMEIYRDLKRKNPEINRGIAEDRPYLRKIFDEEYNLIADDIAGQFQQFTNGKWLEHYLYSMFLKVKEGNKMEFTEIKKNVKEDKDRECEIDMIVIRGFQMFLFSCTTSQRIKTVKQKAFEAIFRAEQLGGEHAKVVIVSTMFNNSGIYNKKQFSKKNNLNELKKDLKQFDADQKCELIGLDELRDETKFKNNLLDIIKYN